MRYRHLTKEERDEIAVLRSKGWKLRKIAVKLGRNIGTLSRELKRNGKAMLCRARAYGYQAAKARAISAA
ncbi:MAG: helix-turn-helix domain-containing protein [Elusimicrobia bacterium]|nr:helix-turn-helix domain-containing protein [Elusimicrobiota bacterium]